MDIFKYFGLFDKNRLARLTFSTAFLILLYRLFNDALLSQLNDPVLVFPGIDRTYWAFLWSGIPDTIVSSPVLATIFDGVMLLSCILSIYFYNKRFLPVIFSFTAAIYFITFNIYAGHHFHGMIGLLLVGIPFWFKSKASYNLSWDAVRYYFLFIFSSAALWKIFRGSVFEEGQLSNILKSQHVEFLLQQPDSWQAGYLTDLIQNVSFSHYLLIGVVILQLTFLVGFFTKRWDALLFILSILFHIGNFLVMRVVSVELLILNLALLPRKREAIVSSLS